MARLGMVVDLSHCSDLTTLAAIRLSPKPVAVTHAGCRALFPQPAQQDRRGDPRAGRQRRLFRSLDDDPMADRRAAGLGRDGDRPYRACDPDRRLGPGSASAATSRWPASRSPNRRRSPPSPPTRRATAACPAPSRSTATSPPPTSTAPTGWRGRPRTRPAPPRPQGGGDRRHPGRQFRPDVRERGRVASRRRQKTRATMMMMTMSVPRPMVTLRFIWISPLDAASPTKGPRSRFPGP